MKKITEEIFDLSEKVGKFSFRNDTVRTGLAAIGALETHAIKHKGKEIGHITEISNRFLGKEPKENIGKYRVSFMVKKEPDEKDPAPFKWVRLKTKFDNVNDAKSYLNDNAEKLHKQLNFHKYEEK